MDFIKLKGVSKVYNKKKVLSDINLNIEEGDIFGIIGKSGSGKTTLLNLLAGFIAPTDGEVVYISKLTKEEKNLTKNIHSIKKHIGFTPQHNSFYHKLTVKENLFHFGKLYGIKKDVLTNNSLNLLQFMQLLDHRNSLAGDLSGGMQRRLDLACSMIHKPKVLILDEPTADLDPILQKEILSLIKEVNRQGVTIIMASHYLDGVENICNKVAILHGGKIHIQGSLDEVRKPFLQDNLTIKLNPGANKDLFIRQLQKLPIDHLVDEEERLLIYPTDVNKTLAYLLAAINEGFITIHDFELKKLPLQDIFEKIEKENLS